MTWQDRAACRGMNTERFYPAQGKVQGHVETIRVCQRCPVQDECLQEAIDTGEKFGIWGGIGARRRRRFHNKPGRARVEFHEAGVVLTIDGEPIDARSARYLDKEAREIAK